MSNAAVGKRIKEIRLAQDKGLWKVADKAGLCAARLACLERGDDDIPYPTLEALAGALETTVGNLVTEEE